MLVALFPLKVMYLQSNLYILQIISGRATVLKKESFQSCLKRLDYIHTKHRFKYPETSSPLDSLLLKFVVHNFHLFIFPYQVNSLDCTWIAFLNAFSSDKSFINDIQFFNLKLSPRQARISNSNAKIMQENKCHYYVLSIFQFTFASFIYYSEVAFIPQQFSATTLALQSFLL